MCWGALRAGWTCSQAWQPRQLQAMAVECYHRKELIRLNQGSLDRHCHQLPLWHRAAQWVAIWEGEALCILRQLQALLAARIR